MHRLSLLPLLLVGCQSDYDNVQACWDWAHHVCGGWNDLTIQRDLDCGLYEDFECDLAEYFDCLEEDGDCPLDWQGPSFGTGPCTDFMKDCERLD